MATVLLDGRLPGGMLVEDDQHRVVIVSAHDDETARAALLQAAGYCPDGDAWTWEGVETAAA